MDAKHSGPGDSAVRRQGWLSQRTAWLLVALATAVFIVMRQGLLPAAWSPLPALDLSDPGAWFVDWRIAELKHDHALCSRVLKAPQISAAAVRANPVKDGCGWDNAVRVFPTPAVRR